MKRLNFILLTLFFFGFSLNAQKQISGKVFDDEKNPIYGAIVILNNGKFVCSTDEYGDYVFKNIETGEYEIRVEHAGFISTTKKLILQMT